MGVETKERLKALEQAIRSDFSGLFDITSIRDKVAATISLANFSIVAEPEDIDHESSFWGSTPDDFKEGYAVRVAAMNLLGRIRDPETVGFVEGKLYDWGDYDGHGSVTQYYRGGYDVQKAALDALVQIGSEGSLKALKKRLERLLQEDKLSGFFSKTQIGESELKAGIKSVKKKLGIIKFTLKEMEAYGVEYEDRVSGERVSTFYDGTGEPCFLEAIEAGAQENNYKVISVKRIQSEELMGLYERDAQFRGRVGYWVEGGLWRKGLAQNSQHK
ncbi:MAG TPA: HEAT repeat domain-containing protein [Candidatus Nanoarchaeia archaeon]|nr:HEAT repeat domain-containing protein [Candidatus Nanoarchaeia archaeon]